MTETYDPYMGAPAAPTLVFDVDGQAHLRALAVRLIAAPCRSIDRDLHALLWPKSDEKVRAPVPRYTTSADAVLRLIGTLLPRWVHGHTYMPAVAEDRAIEVRAWVAGPGYISDDHMRDYFDAEAPTVAGALALALVKCLAQNGNNA